jgi:ornithine decarboxylase
MRNALKKAERVERAASAVPVDPFTPAEIERLVASFGSPLLILDLERVRSQYRRLAAALPRVDLHYALKPLPHPSVVKTLAELGAYFDLATTGEIGLMKALKIAPARCIHTHPVKRDGDIRAALDFGLDTFVADNLDEIAKFEKFRRRAALLLRVSFRSPDAVVDLSRKFGCDAEDVPALLRKAGELGVRIRGFSFHVGSQATDPAKYVEAIRVCTRLMAQAEKLGHGPFDILDIGGGFPVAYRTAVPEIEAFCRPINQALEAVPGTVRVIAEPGRFIVAPAGLGVATVMGRAERQGRWWYYLDDGVYGLFSGQHYEHASYPISSLTRTGPAEPAVLAGPTCDSIDVIDDQIELPRLQNGDLVIAGVMGAYTWATACDFNFFPKPTVVVVNARPGESGTVVTLRR